MTPVQSSLGKMLRERAANRRPTLLPEVKMMLNIITGLGWINLAVGIPSVLMVIFVRSPSLFFTGLLSTLTFYLLRMIVTHIAQSKNWGEVGVVAMGGVYFPLIIMWLCTSNLIDAIPGQPFI